jgi:hypothetical protein
MRMNRLFVIVMGAGILMGLATWVSGETLYGTRDRPLSGERYDILRALARHVDETAQGAVEGATDDAKRGTRTSARFLSSIRAFARQAGDFRRSMENYRTAPFEVPSQVAALAARARSVDERLRAARAMESTHDEWEAIRDVLERMRLVLAGRDVDVPTAHVVLPLSGPRLEEFRQLARDLDASATRAWERSKLDVADYPLRGPQFLGELEHFAARIRELLDHAAASPVDPQQVGPLVDRVLAEARQADRTMRDARVFASVWDDSGRTITILERMATLVRS